MDKKETFIFQIDSPDVIKTFEEKNYLIEYNENINCDKNLCVIYFSSNEIYYPNTFKSFKYSILERDKFEWKRNKFTNAHKHIFIRDIQKQWYLGGINTKLDTPKKLLEFLKIETTGYNIYTIGSSAGGYAAILYGSLLIADRVYAFNGQLNLLNWMKSSNPLKDPILFNKVEYLEWQPYYNLSNFLNSKTDYYYFQSCFSKIDISQYNALDIEARKFLKTVRFKTSNHGFPFLRNNLPNLLNMKKEELELLVGNNYNLFLFSFKLVGVKDTISFFLKALLARYRKKRLESYLNQK